LIDVSSITNGAGFGLRHFVSGSVQRESQQLRSNDTGHFCCVMELVDAEGLSELERKQSEGFWQQ